MSRANSRPVKDRKVGLSNNELTPKVLHQLIPGIHTDGESIYLVMTDFLRFFKIPDTPEGRIIVRAQFDRTKIELANIVGDLPVIELESLPTKAC